MGREKIQSRSRSPRRNDATLKYDDTASSARSSGLHEHATTPETQFPDLRARLLNHLRGIWFRSITESRNAKGLASTDAVTNKKKEDEEAFFNTVGQLLKTGMKPAEIMIMIDEDKNYNEYQQMIFKEWVKAAVLRNKAGMQLLDEKTPPKAGPTPLTGSTETLGNHGKSRQMEPTTDGGH